MAYDFHYTPTGTGVISGKEVLEQTEDAINDLGNTAISGVQEALDKAEQALTNSENAVDDAQTALNTANNAEGVAIQAQTDVGNLSGTVTNIGNRVTTAEGNISNLQGRMTTAEGNITNLQGRMTTAETNIGNLQTAVSTAQATANSAQQTATTARQQSYVFRYSGTAITDNSTIAYSTIDNTDNIKSGDKILDVDGKLFEITAVDTTNQTVTVGSALIDLALDANVVHTSGNETKSGELTLSDTLNSSDIVPIANNSYSSGSSNNQWNNIYSMNYYYNGVAWGLDKSNTWTSSQTYSAGYYGQMVWLKNTDLDLSVNGNTGLSSIYQHMIHWVDKNNAVYSSIQSWTASSETTLVLRSKYRTDANTIRELSVRFTSTATNKVIYPETNADTELGTSTNKWKSFNGLEPSSLSLPSGNLNDVIDISSYITALDGTDNSYTVPANGWISIAVVGTAIAIVSSSWSDSRLKESSGNVRMLYPVLKNETLDISVIGTTLDYARFIPCQGNI